MLRGFAKNYFRLVAIQAYSANAKLQAIKSAFLHSLINPKEYSLKDLKTVLLQQSDKPCHCNLFFRVRIRLILLLNVFIPRCPYYTTHYAFRRTGVHPPL